MIGMNQGMIIGFVHKDPKFFVNKKDHPQSYVTIQQPNPKAFQQKDQKGRFSIYVTLVCFDQIATEVRDKIHEGDFVVAHYTIRNYRRARGGFGHSLQLVNIFPFRVHRDRDQAARMLSELGEFTWDEICDGPLAERLPEDEEVKDGDRAWSFGSG